MSRDFDELVRQAILDAIPAVAEALRPVIRDELAALGRAGDPDELVDVDEVARIFGRTPQRRSRWSRWYSSMSEPTRCRVLLPARAQNSVGSFPRAA